VGLLPPNYPPDYPLTTPSLAGRSFFTFFRLFREFHETGKTVFPRHPGKLQTTPPKGGLVWSFSDLRKRPVWCPVDTPEFVIPRPQSWCRGIIQKRHRGGPDYPPLDTQTTIAGPAFGLPPQGRGVGRPQIGVYWNLSLETSEVRSRSQLLRVSKLRFLDTPPEGWAKLGWNSFQK
jgi:hypothetical protein